MPYPDRRIDKDTIQEKKIIHPVQEAYDEQAAPKKDPRLFCRHDLNTDTRTFGNGRFRLFTEKIPHQEDHRINDQREKKMMGEVQIPPGMYKDQYQKHATQDIHRHDQPPS